MSCNAALIELELDGELDARSALELSDHLTRCPLCTERRASLRALSQAARMHLPRYTDLPSRVLPRRRRRALWALPAAAAAVAAIFLLVPRHDPLLDEVVNAHARSLQLAHAIDVPSSDKHTVKPWFEGKVGFAVPVREAPGFALEGGRLDYLDGRPAAALVYRHGQHLVNVFIVNGGTAEKPRESSLRGFHVWRWTADGLTWFVVSDMDDVRALLP